MILHDAFGSSRDKVCQPRRGVIITPGALGDSLLMLPLAQFMKQTLGLHQLEMIGHLHHIGFYLGRTCIDMVRSIDSVEFHRLFVEEKSFSVDDCESLVSALARYDWIVSFLGHGHSDFESNLIFAVNCRQAADIAFLPLLPPADSTEHVSDFYVRQFQQTLGDAYEFQPWTHPIRTVHPKSSDAELGREFLRSAGLDPQAKLAVLHPGSGGVAKCWPLDNFAALAAILKQNGLQIAFLLGPAEEERFSPDQIRQLQSAGKVLSDLTITESLWLLCCADLFVGNDSGISHLAAALGIRSLVLFGPSNPCLYQPIGPHVRILAESPATFARPDPQSVQKVAEAALQRLAD
jgi:heptosyltransferase III